jgi:fibronectin-binding autotransporter adhesin
MIAIKTMKDSNRSFAGDSSSNRTAKRLHDPTLSNRVFAIFFIVTILIALAFLLAPKAGATNRTWSNTGTDFNAGASWGGTAPGSGDVAVFANVKVTNPNLSASLTIQELNFSTTASSGYDLTSSSTSIKLTLTNTGTGTTSAINAANTSGTNTIDAPLVLGAAASSTQTFTQASGGTLIVNGIISSTNSSVTLSLTGGGTGNFQFFGANTYTGATTIDGGTLKLGNATALGTIANGTTVGSNATATLDLNGQAVGAEALDITGSGIGGNGALINSSGTAASLSGAVSTSSTPTIGGSGNITLSGVISGGSDSSSSHLVKVGAGTLFLTGTNTYARPTDITSGVVNIQNAAALGNTNAATTVSNGAALQIQGGIITAAELLTLNGTGVSTDGALRNISGNNTYAGAITLATASRINSDLNTLTLDVASGNAITGTFNLTFGGAGNVTVNDPIATSTGTLTKDGAGVLTLSGANTYTGITTISAGTLSANKIVVSSSNSSLGNATSAVILGGTSTAGTLSYTGAAATYTRGFTVNAGGGGITNAGTGLLTIGTGAIANSGSLTFNANASGITVNSIISGLGSIIKIGAGSLTLANTSNSFAGGTLINVGTVQAIADGALGGGNVSLTASGVALTLSGGATNNYISNNASISIVTGSTVNLNFAATAADQVAAFVINGVSQAPGFYNSTNEPGLLFGTGNLLVVIPEPSTWAMITVGAGLLLGAQRFRKKKS